MPWASSIHYGALTRFATQHSPSRLFHLHFRTRKNGYSCDPVPQRNLRYRMSLQRVLLTTAAGWGMQAPLYEIRLSWQGWEHIQQTPAATELPFMPWSEMVVNWNWRNSNSHPILPDKGSEIRTLSQRLNAYKWTNAHIQFDQVTLDLLTVPIHFPLNYYQGLVHPLKFFFYRSKIPLGHRPYTKSRDNLMNTNSRGVNYFFPVKNINGNKLVNNCFHGLIELQYPPFEADES